MTVFIFFWWLGSSECFFTAFFPLDPYLIVLLQQLQNATPATSGFRSQLPHLLPWVSSSDSHSQRHLFFDAFSISFVLYQGGRIFILTYVNFVISAEIDRIVSNVAIFKQLSIALWKEQFDWVLRTNQIRPYENIVKLWRWPQSGSKLHTCTQYRQSSGLYCT